ncbi:MAG: hypothetical protein ACKOHM_00090 [Spartobacteria bacterium]
MDNEDSITKLLRLKRYEQPPEEYFQSFLAEFQTRQRSEVIHRPLLQIAWDRFSSMFVMPPVPKLVMASSFAAAVFAAVFVLNWADDGTSNATFATASGAAKWDSKARSAQGQKSPAVQYVLPARPVSYASARSF